MRKALPVLVLALAATACSGVNLPPKAGPEEVELIQPNMGQQPREGYEVIGPVRVLAPVGTNQSELVTMLRARAAELGADAVIFEGISRSESPDATREQVIVTGTAIYYPPAGT